jgi:hypothetical protein
VPGRGAVDLPPSCAGCSLIRDPVLERLTPVAQRYQHHTGAQPSLHTANLSALAGMAKLGETLLEVLGQERRLEQIVDRVLLAHVLHLVQRVLPLVGG